MIKVLFVKDTYYIFSCRQCQIADWPQHRISCTNEQRLDPIKTPEETSKILSQKVICQGNNSNDTLSTKNFDDDSLPPPRRGFVITTKSCSDKKQISENERFCQNSLSDNIIEGASSQGYRMPQSLFRLNHTEGKIDEEICITPLLDETQPCTTVHVKSNKEKSKILLQNSWSGQEMLHFIAHKTQIPPRKLKLIHKGKLVSKDNIKENIREKALFQAIGEKSECEDGLDGKDIDILMQQMSVERNCAVRALRKSEDLVDAVFHIANK